MITMFLEKTGAMVRDREMIYKALVQTVLLYSRESWVITGEMMKVMEDFHHRIVRRLTGRLTSVLGKKVGNPPGRRGYRGVRAGSNAVICTEAAGNHCGVHFNTPNIRAV